MMPEQELSPEEAAAEQAARNEQAAAVATEGARKRKARVAVGDVAEHYVVATTTHGKLVADRVEQTAGWVTLQAPIVTIDTSGEMHRMDESVLELSVPAAAVRQITRERS